MTGAAILAVGQVDAWRAWRLSRRGGRPALVPNGRGPGWPCRRSATAACWRARRHRAPVPGCTCGLYGVRDPWSLREARSPAVVGTVALWGTVIEHAGGYRGQFGYPQRLRLVCHVCILRWGPAGAEPEAVAAYRDGSLVPLCEEHLELSREVGRHRFHVLEPSEVLGGLTNAYAVEPILRIAG